MRKQVQSYPSRTGTISPGLSTGNDCAKLCWIESNVAAHIVGPPSAWRPFAVEPSPCRQVSLALSWKRTLFATGAWILAAIPSGLLLSDEEPWRTGEQVMRGSTATYARFLARVRFPQVPHWLSGRPGRRPKPFGSLSR